MKKRKRELRTNFTIRFRPSEKLKLEQLANKSGMPISELIREKLFK